MIAVGTHWYSLFICYTFKSVLKSVVFIITFIQSELMPLVCGKGRAFDAVTVT